MAGAGFRSRGLHKETCGCSDKTCAGRCSYWDIFEALLEVLSDTSTPLGTLDILDRIAILLQEVVAAHVDELVPSLPQLLLAGPLMEVVFPLGQLLLGQLLLHPPHQVIIAGTYEVRDVRVGLQVWPGHGVGGEEEVGVLRGPDLRLSTSRRGLHLLQFMQ